MPTRRYSRDHINAELYSDLQSVGMTCLDHTKYCSMGRTGATGKQLLTDSL